MAEQVGDIVKVPDERGFTDDIGQQALMSPSMLAIYT